MKVLVRIDGRIRLWAVLDDQRVNRIREILDFLVLDSVRCQYLEQVNRRRFNLALDKDLPRHLPHELVSDLRHSNPSV